MTLTNLKIIILNEARQEYILYDSIYMNFWKMQTNL
jgi:uncharacterized membrane protein YobD (UPF0266 family)